MHEFPRRPIVFELPFPQTDPDVDVFMEITSGMGVYVNIGEWVLNLNKSLYGIKKASANWFDLLKTGIERRFYHQYQVEPCVFYRKDSVILTCFYYCVIVSQKQDTITSLIESLNNGPENHVLKDEGDISNYLGVNIN